jgi:hypothetical protein
MRTMKYILTAILCLNLIYAGVAQSRKNIEVTSGHAPVQEVDRQGLQVLIELDEKFVTKTWIQKLKEYGKVETEKGGYVIHGASIPEISSACTIYSALSTTKTGTKVFWAIDIGSGYIKEGESHYNTAKKKLYDFAVSAYVADINVQISTAEDALSSSVKDHEKLVKQGENLKSDTQKNIKEKADLEKKLVENAANLKTLESEEIKIESRLKDTKATENTDEQQKLLKESMSITNNIGKNKQQKISLEDKLKDNEAERIKLESDTKTNASNQAAAKDEVAKMTKALEVVKDKLKAYQ